jgi:predicted histidine transporter YuiF (NhaC family)
MIGFGVGMLFGMVCNIYNQYKMDRYYTESYLKHKAELEKVSSKYR